MNKITYLFFLVTILFFGTVQGQEVVTFGTPGTFTWKAPADVTSVEVEAWGGGGNGGTTSGNLSGAGGGGGGAYVRSTLPVVPGNDYTVFVGSSSADSYFINETTLLAKGGESVENNTASGGQGGSATASFGDVTSKGLDGVSNNGAKGGKGGNGGSATGGEGGAGGGNKGKGTNGDAPGGGGGGAGKGTAVGGSGGNGKIIITYNITCPTSVDNTTSTASIDGDTTKSLTASPTGGTFSIISGGGSISGSTYTAPSVTADTDVTIRYSLTQSGCPTVTDDVTFTVLDNDVDQCDASAPGNLDTDGDGVSDICDLDSDNDGILDTDETFGENFDIADGNSVSLNIPYVGEESELVIDFTSLDNSFNVTFNGQSLNSSFPEIQYQVDNVPANSNFMRFTSDDCLYGDGDCGLNEIYNITDADPLIRVIIDGNGNISFFGRRNASSPLEAMYAEQGVQQFTWSSTNELVLGQAVVGPTYAIVNISAFVDTDGDGVPNYLDLDSDGDGCSDANEYYSNGNADGNADGLDNDGFGGLTYGTEILTSTNTAVDADGLVIGASYTAVDTGLADSIDSAITDACEFIQVTDGDFNVTTNWREKAVPTFNNYATINDGITSTVIANQEVKNLTTKVGSTVSIDNTFTLNIKEDLIHAGDFTGPGEVILNGTSDQNISGGGSFENLRLDNPTSASINDPSDLFGVLYVDQGTLNTNDNLSLRCVFGIPPKTAQVGPVATGSSINGNVTVEQCYPARRAFRLLTSSVTTTGSNIHDNWQEGATAWNDNSVPDNYGTHITGLAQVAGSGHTVTSAGGDQFKGLDWQPSGNPSMYSFNNSGRSWDPVLNTIVGLTAGVPYRLLIRGDRKIDITDNGTNPRDTRLRATGELTVGASSQTDFSTTSAGSFNLIANPYHAQVDMRLLTDPANSTNIRNTFYYVWDPTLGGTPTVGQPGGRGAYVAVDLSDGSTSFLDPNETGTPTNTANVFLQPMQAAFILVDAAAAAEVEFKESYKNVNATQTETKSLSDKQYINIQLFDSDSYNVGESASDGLRINFDKAFSPTSEDDAPKLGNLDENLARKEGNAYSAIERRPFPEAEEKLELFINQYRRGVYVMKFDMTDNLNTKVFIEDKYLNQTQEITSTDDVYSFTVDESISESTATDRFSIVLNPVSLSTIDETLVEASLYPNPTKGNFSISGVNLGEDAEIEIYNMIGQQVYKTNLESGPATEVKDFNGSAGVYLVKLKTNQGERTFKLIKQ